MLGSLPRRDHGFPQDLIFPTQSGRCPRFFVRAEILYVRYWPKADMGYCGSPLLRSLLGVKRTWAVAPHMSAFDPKRTSRLAAYLM